MPDDHGTFAMVRTTLPLTAIDTVIGIDILQDCYFFIIYLKEKDDKCASNASPTGTPAV
jgi:hypothetical protein